MVLMNLSILKAAAAKNRKKKPSKSANVSPGRNILNPYRFVNSPTSSGKSIRHLDTTWQKESSRRRFEDEQSFVNNGQSFTIR